MFHFIPYIYGWNCFFSTLLTNISIHFSLPLQCINTSSIHRFKKVDQFFAVSTSENTTKKVCVNLFLFQSFQLASILLPSERNTVYEKKRKVRNSFLIIILYSELCMRAFALSPMLNYWFSKHIISWNYFKISARFECKLKKQATLMLKGHFPPLMEQEGLARERKCKWMLNWAKKI